MNRRPVVGVATLFLLALLLAAGPTLGAELGSAEEHVKRGRRHLQEFEFGSALAAFELVASAYHRGGLDLDVPGTRRVVTAALEGMAEAHLGIGNRDAAAEQFVTALQVYPAYEPDRDRHSPKLIDIFDEVRKTRIGYLDLNIYPMGARVEIDGIFVGNAPLLSVPWTAGPLQIVVEHPGHATFSKNLFLEAGGRLNVADQLIASARSVLFTTSPIGVTIFVDGRKVGVTVGPGSHDLAREHGLNFEDLSSDTLVEHLSAGAHTVRFERDCSVSREMRINVELELNAGPLRFAPVVLESSTATLEIEAGPWEGRVLVDGKELGKTPGTVRELCSGRHDVEVIGTPYGRWSATVDLKAGERRQLVATLRPTLAFLGLAGGNDVPEKTLKNAQAQMEEGIGRLTGYHRVVPDPSEGLKRGQVLLLRGDGTLPMPDADSLQDVAVPFGADLLLVGQVRMEKLRPVLDLLLYSTVQERPDRLEIHLDGPQPLEPLVTRMMQRPRLERLWIGLRVSETRIREHPLVVELYTGGPAHEGGLRLGDRITAVNHAPVTSQAEWDAAIEAIRSDWEEESRGKGGKHDRSRSITVVVQRGDGEEKLLDVVISWAPDLMGPGLPEVLYNQRLVDFSEYLAGGRDDDYGRGIVRLNQALAFIHFRRYDLALQRGLMEAQLPEGQGVSRGTVEYLRGWCYEQLGPEYHPEAKAAFEAAAQADGATLETHLGPAVAPLARQHLKALR